MVLLCTWDLEDQEDHKDQEKEDQDRIIMGTFTWGRERVDQVDLRLGLMVVREFLVLVMEVLQVRGMILIMVLLVARRMEEVRDGEEGMEEVPGW
jgi:hypothetical protein